MSKLTPSLTPENINKDSQVVNMLWSYNSRCVLGEKGVMGVIGFAWSLSIAHTRYHM
jgi:hypothetical protein